MFGKTLLTLGLIVLPFLPLIKMAGRPPQLMLAMAIALALGFWGLFKGGMKPLNNRWIFLWFFAGLFSAWQCPKPIFEQLVKQFGLDVGAFWIWEALFIPLCFLLMICAMSLIRDRKFFLKIMVWMGFLFAVHSIFQSFGLHQWINLSLHKDTLNTPQALVTSFFDHPTLLAPFIAMLVPITLYFKMWYKAGIMAVAVVLTYSALGIGAMIVSLFLLFFILGKKQAIVGLALVVLLSGALWGGYNYSKAFRGQFSFSGRVIHWKQMWKDLAEPYILVKEKDGKVIEKLAYPYTGFGPGSFRYMYHLRYNNKMYQAHNEYAEIGYNHGLIGLSIFLIAFLVFLGNIKITKENKYLFSSFACISLCAGGTFIWQLGLPAFYTATVVGFLMNKEDYHVSHFEDENM